MTYEQVCNRHPGAVVEVCYRPLDASHPEVERVPTATAPAVRVWPDRETARSRDEIHAVAIYWLVDPE